jgi:hypothetical protein
VLSVARASLLNSHSDVLGNRIERKICKNLPKQTLDQNKTHGREISTPFFYLGYHFFFFTLLFFFSLLCSFRFFFKQHITERFCTSSNITESFVKSETRLVVLKGTEETFAAVEREITTEKSVRQRNYTYIIVLLVVEFK